MCLDVAACLHDALPRLIMLQELCPVETERALDVIDQIALADMEVCTNATMDHGMDAHFMPSHGVFYTLARCAIQFLAVEDTYFSFMAWAPFRSYVCGVREVTAASPRTASANEQLGLVYSALCATLLASSLALSAYVCALYVRRRCKPTTFVKGMHAAAWISWTFFLLFTVMHSSDSGMPQDDLYDFYYKDPATACAFNIRRETPNAIIQDNMLSLVTTERSAKEVYETVRHLDVHGHTLASVCGHCSLFCMGAADLVSHLVLDTPLKSPGDRQVTINMLLPPFADGGWRRALARRLHALGAPRPDLAFITREQAARDVHDSVRVGEATMALSAALTFGMVFGSIHHICGRAAVLHALVVSSAVFALLYLSFMAGKAARACLGVDPSPFDVVVLPLLLGTGVDSAFILLSSYTRTGTFEHAWPSIFGSQLTTLCSFVAGLWIPVPHLTRLFATCIATTIANTALQVVTLPPLIGALVEPASARKAYCTAGLDAPRRASWKYAVAMLFVLWLVLLPLLQPVGTASDISFQVAEDSMTRRFLERSGSGDASPSPVYVLVRDMYDANWTDVRRRVAEDVDASMLVDWYATYQTSPEYSIDEWMQQPMANVAYRSFLSETSNASVLVAARAHNGGGAVETLEALRRKSTADVCFADVDDMAVYTVDVTSRRIWILAMIIMSLSTTVGIGIAGKHGAMALPAIAMSYAATLAFIGVAGIHIHMLLIAVFVIAPGLLVDFVLHLTYNPSMEFAVFMSAMTSVTSMVPYVFTSLPGVRDFAVTYIGFLVIGLIHAFAATFTHAVRWEAL